MADHHSVLIEVVFSGTSIPVEATITVEGDMAADICFHHVDCSRPGHLIDVSFSTADAHVPGRKEDPFTDPLEVARLGVSRDRFRLDGTVSEYVTSRLDHAFGVSRRGKLSRTYLKCVTVPMMQMFMDVIGNTSLLDSIPDGAVILLGDEIERNFSIGRVPVGLRMTD